MAIARPNGNIGITAAASDVVVLNEAENGLVSRFLVHMRTNAGSVAVTARVHGSAGARVAAAIVYSLGSTTSGSAIASTGLYVLDASGLDVALTPDGSIAFDFIPLVG